MVECSTMYELSYINKHGPLAVFVQLLKWTKNNLYETAFQINAARLPLDIVYEWMNENFNSCGKRSKHVA